MITLFERSFSTLTEYSHGWAAFNFAQYFFHSCSVCGFFSHDAKAGSPDDLIEQFISRELKERERSCVIDVQSKMDMGHFRHTHTNSIDIVKRKCDLLRVLCFPAEENSETRAEQATPKVAFDRCFTKASSHSHIKMPVLERPLT